jgi:hypothetical protein
LHADIYLSYVFLRFSAGAGTFKICVGIQMRFAMLCLISAMATALCAVVAAAWVRSAWRTDEFAVAGQRKYFVQSYGGKLGFGVARWWTYSGADALEVANRNGPHTDPPMVETRYPRRVIVNGGFYRLTDLQSGWFGSSRQGISNLSRGRFTSEWADIVYLPHWAAIAALLPFALAAVPGLMARRRRRRLRRAMRCENCGYDLRATPGKCPECGSVVGNPKSETRNPNE